jgi:hypothetical protein
VFNLSEKNDLYFYESQILSVLPGYREYLGKVCNCDVFNFSNFYRYILSSSNYQDVYTLSSNERLILIKDYLKIIHNFNLNFERIEIDLPSSESRNEIALFKLYKQ